MCEAHAADEWPIGAPVTVSQHNTREDRAAACSDMMDALQVTLPTYLDSMDNSFNEAYACWPLRFYLLDNGIIEHVAQPTNGAYNPLEIEQWLDTKL